MTDPTSQRLPGGRDTGCTPLLVAVMLVAGLASGCAGRQVKSSAADPTATLEQRVAERWQLVIARDYVAAYAYLTPGYRSTYGVSDYVARETRMPLRFLGAEQAGVECASPDSCLVDVDVRYSARLPGAGDVQSINRRQERWLLTDGVWHLLPE